MWEEEKLEVDDNAVQLVKMLLDNVLLLLLTVALP
jgi:hypothetical protein